LYSGTVTAVPVVWKTGSPVLPFVTLNNHSRVLGSEPERATAQPTAFVSISSAAAGVKARLPSLISNGPETPTLKVCANGHALPAGGFETATSCDLRKTWASVKVLTPRIVKYRLSPSFG
jgi:hypothetical protein